MDHKVREDSYRTNQWINNNGCLHRVDGPAVECFDGHKEWWFNGIRHREGGPAVEYVDGHKEWFFNGKLHREDGPAAEWADGTKIWSLHGLIHRVDGPAVEYKDGGICWFLKGRRFKTKETWFKALKKEDKMKALFSEHFIQK